MDTIALILSIVGCVNWGLVGIFQFDLVAWLFGGSGSLFSRLVYTVVAMDMAKNTKMGRRWRRKL